MFLLQLLDIYSFVVLAAVLVSYLQLAPDHPVPKFLAAATEPVLAPVRRLLPDTGGFDFSPMVVFIGISVLRRLLIGLV